MQKAKKFGAFAGVFTPSILTILGVIMYMRLGWVVGEAGLIGAILIIIVAHVISISTGLSISSIATDKKIKTGGIYYMLSRSLGLPMGGAIGLSLVVGTALSISLYIVGFSESFLAVESIRNFFGLGITINDFRILGSIVLIVLVAIAFISTSLAIRIQYVVLAAIALSLISIFVGFFVNQAYVPENIVLLPVRDGLPLEYVFSIYFPAVTGFTAGVAMSGDLKNPKKDIPKGTLLAVITGFVVYVLLSVGFAFFVNRDLLINDSNFLMQVAWFPPLVIAGIWGATLSSALGGILGAPRILQAIAKDKIVPKILSIGYGKNNEPRNALILIFLIAEGGILIGDLNIIAGVVSMFFLASYGFINISYSLESWASVDFRPSFRIPRYIGIIGFVASFIVMFKIDMVSMIFAFILIGAIYLFLRHKNFRNEYGDVWKSVWSSIIRKALKKLESGDIEKRNWRPNIILFSGGANSRPHLIRLGKALLGNQGILSNFDLIEKKSAKTLFPKSKQMQTKLDNSEDGIFTRVQDCRDIYEGIETISSTYGFAGVEPNTVLMGWGRQSKDPKRFAQMVETLSQLDQSILMVDYDEEVGFGKKKLIDIWWRGAGNNGNFALTLVRFLIMDDDWTNAKVRLLVVNPENEDRDLLLERTKKILNDFRIDVEIVIINNKIEQKSFYDIIRRESLNSDLILLGLPNIEKGNAIKLVEQTNELTNNIGTVVLIKASSYFSDLYIVDKNKYISSRISQKELDTEISVKNVSWELNFPKNTVVSEQLHFLHDTLIASADNYYENYAYKVAEENSKLIESIKKLVANNFVNIKHELKGNNRNQKQVIFKYQTNILTRTRKIISEFNNENLKFQHNNLNRGLYVYIDVLTDLLQNIPNKLKIKYYKDDLLVANNDSLNLKWYKQISKLKIFLVYGKDSVNYNIKYKDLISQYIPIKIYALLEKIFNKLGEYHLKFSIDLQSAMKHLSLNFWEIEKSAEINKLKLETLDEIETKIINELDIIKKAHFKSHRSLYQLFTNDTSEVIRKINSKFDILLINRDIKVLSKRTEKRYRAKILNIPNQWFSNQKLIYNNNYIGIMLLSFEYRVRKIFDEVISEIENIYDELLINKLNEFILFLNKYQKEIKSNTKPEFSINPDEFIDEQNIFQIKEKFESSIRKLKYAVRKFPEKITVISDNSYNNYLIEQFEGVDVLNVSASRLLDYILQNDLIEPIQKLINSIPEDLKAIQSSSRDIIRHIDFNIRQKGVYEHSELDTYFSEMTELFGEQKQKTENLLSLAKKQKTEIIQSISSQLNTIFNQLSHSSFTKSGVNIKQYIKEQTSLKRKSISLRTKSSIINGFKKQIEQFWYRQSIGVLVSKSVSKNTSGDTRVNKILNLVEHISFDKAIINKLPFYYKQLFLRKQYYYNEFWFGREKGLKDAEIAIERYNSGFKGGLLILGESGSGKTFFSHYISSKYFNSQNTYIVNPPFSGSISPKTFKANIEKAVDVYGTYDEIFEKIPKKSVIIIDDLELWWEKNLNGYEVVKIILELIRNYSSKCFFIANLNTYTYEFIKKIIKIENSFLNIIECDYFDAKTIKNIVLFRHNSGNLNLLNSKGEKIRPIGEARFFSNIFNLSQGNINTALHLWLSSITEIKNDTIKIRNIKHVDSTVLLNLPADWYIVLVQLFLHKRLNRKSLSGVLMKSDIETDVLTDALLRTGLIIEEKVNTFIINPQLYIYIRKALIEKNMI